MDRQPAPDYTNAFLVSLAPIVFIALMVTWVVAGLLGAGALGYAADKGINRIDRIRNRA